MTSARVVRATVSVDKEECLKMFSLRTYIESNEMHSETKEEGIYD